MADSESKGGFAWGTVTTVGCGLISALWLYLQLQVWKEEGHDHMLTAANIVVTILLWAALCLGAFKNFRDARRAKSLKQNHTEELRKLEMQSRAELSSCAQIRDEYAAEKRKAEEKVKELEEQLSSFSPLQIEAQQLRRDLTAFLKEEEIRLKNSTNSAFPPGDGWWEMVRHNPDPQLYSKYELEFMNRAREVCNKIVIERGASGLDRLIFITRHAASCEAIQELIDALWQAMNERYQ